MFLCPWSGQSASRDSTWTPRMHPTSNLELHSSLPLSEVRVHRWNESGQWVASLSLEWGRWLKRLKDLEGRSPKWLFYYQFYWRNTQGSQVHCRAMSSLNCAVSVSWLLKFCIYIIIYIIIYIYNYIYMNILINCCAVFSSGSYSVAFSFCASMSSRQFFSIFFSWMQPRSMGSTLVTAVFFHNMNTTAHVGTLTSLAWQTRQHVL